MDELYTYINTIIQNKDYDANHIEKQCENLDFKHDEKDIYSSSKLM